MNTKEEIRLQELEVENESLKSKLKNIEESRKSKRKRSLWFGKKAFGFFIGIGLKESLRKGIDEFNKTKNISSESLSNIGAHLIWRITRIGLLGLVIALLPTLFMALQTRYLNIQNDKICLLYTSPSPRDS